MKPTLNIITSCYRMDYAKRNLDSLNPTDCHDIKINWHFAFDDGDYSYGSDKMNRCLDNITHGWVWILDNDNLIHPSFIKELTKILKETDKKALVFSQVNGKKACPENIHIGCIDIAQYVVNREFIGDLRLSNTSYTSDCEFISTLYSWRPLEFQFIDKELIYYNEIINQNISEDVRYVKTMRD